MRVDSRLLRALVVTAAMVCWLAPSVQAQGKVHLFVEAESFDGVPRYPYDWEHGKGWYGREFTCRAVQAPGLGWAAVIHGDAPTGARTMSIKLDKPIPAGKYRVFLRTNGPISELTQPVILQVGFDKQSVRYTWESSAKANRRFKWKPGVDFTLTSPAKTLSLTAAQFGGRSYGVLYNPMKQAICVDTVYVTNDLSLKAPPAYEAEKQLRGGLAVKPLPKRQAWITDSTSVYNCLTPAPVGEVVKDPIKLQSFDGRKNVWPNSSFELGMNDGWAIKSPPAYVLTDKDLDADNPYHGKYSLRVPEGNMMAFSRPYYLEADGVMTLSIAVRGEGGKAAAELCRLDPKPDKRTGRPAVTGRVRPLATAGGVTGKQWRRLAVSCKMPAGWYYLRVQCETKTWLDAIQLEPGGAATDYAPRAELEGAIRSGQLANIIHEEDQNTLDLWFHNSSAASKQAVLDYRIVDHREGVVASGKTPAQSVAAGATVKGTISLPERCGIFSVSFGISGRRMPEGESVYVVMPRPSVKPTRHELGGNMMIDVEEMRAQSRLGLKWVLTCKSRPLSSCIESVHKKPGEWKFRNDLARLPKENGMEVIPNFWPNRIPEFMFEKPNVKVRPMRRVVRAKRVKLDLWAEHIEKMVRNYKDLIKIWCIEDEMEYGGWDPYFILPVLQTSLSAAKKGWKDVEIGLSGTPDYVEELIALGLDPKSFEWMGGSFHDLQYWFGTKSRHLQERYGKPTISYGVGQRPPSYTMYHTDYRYMPVYGKIIHQMRQMINYCLIQDIKIAGHYAAVFRNDGIHKSLNKPLVGYDGTPLPWGTAFGMLGTLLADARRVEEVNLGDSDRLVTIFRNKGKLCAVTHAINTTMFEFHWRPAWRRMEGLTLPCEKGAIELKDVFWNDLQGVTWGGNGARFTLTEEPVFVVNNSLSDKAFRDMFAKVRVPQRPYSIDMTLVPAGKGVGLKVTVTNRTKADLTNVFLDFRYPRNVPWCSVFQSVLPVPVAGIKRVAAGRSASVVLPTLLPVDAPFEAGYPRSNMKAEGGVSFAEDGALWMMPTPKKTVRLDGKLDEWTAPAAWLCFDWALNTGSRGVEQIWDGGQFFSYPPYRLDARCAVWTGWDENNLYVGVRVEDDELVLDAQNGEAVRIVAGSGGKKLNVLLKPLAGGKVNTSVPGVQARWAPIRTTIENGARLKKEQVTYLGMEVAIPWASIGGRPAADAAGTFDLFWTDADHEDGKLVRGTLRWAGHAKEDGAMLLTQ